VIVGFKTLEKMQREVERKLDEFFEFIVGIRGT